MSEFETGGAAPQAGEPQTHPQGGIGRSPPEHPGEQVLCGDLLQPVTEEEWDDLGAIRPRSDGLREAVDDLLHIRSNNAPRATVEELLRQFRHGQGSDEDRLRRVLRHLGRSVVVEQAPMPETEEMAEADFAADMAPKACAFGDPEVAARIKQRPRLCEKCGVETGADGSVSISIWKRDRAELAELKARAAFGLDEMRDLAPAFVAWAREYISLGRLRECIQERMIHGKWEQTWKDDEVPAESYGELVDALREAYDGVRLWRGITDGFLRRLGFYDENKSLGSVDTKEHLQRVADELLAARRKVSELEASLEIRDAAHRRARELWQARHPGETIWPDLAENIVWLVEQATAQAPGDRMTDEELARRMHEAASAGVPGAVKWERFTEQQVQMHCVAARCLRELFRPRAKAPEGDLAERAKALQEDPTYEREKALLRHIEEAIKLCDGYKPGDVLACGNCGVGHEDTQGEHELASYPGRSDIHFTPIDDLLPVLQATLSALGETDPAALAGRSAEDLVGLVLIRARQVVADREALRSRVAELERERERAAWNHERSQVVTHQMADQLRDHISRLTREQGDLTSRLKVLQAQAQEMTASRMQLVVEFETLRSQLAEALASRSQAEERAQAVEQELALRRSDTEGEDRELADDLCRALAGLSLSTEILQRIERGRR